MPRVSSVALAHLVLLLTSPAQAGNDDTYFMSGEAALMGGTVVALGQGAGMTWYNPAGLGAIHRNQYDLTLSGGAYQRRVVPRGLSVLVPGTGGDVELRSTLDGSRATTIAPASVYARRFGKVTLAAGFFTTRDDVIRSPNASAPPRWTPTRWSISTSPRPESTSAVASASISSTGRSGSASPSSWSPTTPTTAPP